MSILEQVLVKAGLLERRMNERIAVSGLEVSYSSGRERWPAKVKDISSTGIYLLTEDRPAPGTAMQLNLRNRGRREGDSQREVRLRARCVRRGEDGIGLTFAEEAARADWAKRMALSSEVLPGSGPIHLLRLTKALGFLAQVAPAAEAQVLQLLSEIGREGAEPVIDMLLQAEERLALRKREAKTFVSADLLVHVLECGSKCSEEGLKQCWEGFLASCCIDAAEEKTTRHLADLLSRLEPCHVSVLTEACCRAMRTGWRPGFVFPAALYCPLEEMRMISGIQNPLAVEPNLNFLHQLGLIEKTEKPLSCERLEQANITPTALGLKLYARCCGETTLPEVLECRPAFAIAS